MLISAVQQCTCALKQDKTGLGLLSCKHTLDLCLWKYYLTSEIFWLVVYKMRITDAFQDKCDDFKIHVCYARYPVPAQLNFN